MPQKERPDLSKTQSFPGYLAHLSETRASGTLVVSSRNVQREFRLSLGEVRAARSNADGERLGAWLIDRGLLSEDDRALCLLRQDGGETQPLGQLLVDRGLIAADALDAELEALALAITAHAAAEPRGYCGFEEGLRNPGPDTFPTLTTTQIILIAAREFTNTDVKRETVGSFDQLIARAKDLDTLIFDLTLTTTEGFLLSRLEGPRTLATVEAATALQHDEMLAIVYTLLTAGLVSLASAPSTSRPATRPQPSQAAPAPPSTVEVNEDALLDGQVKERRKVVARTKDLRNLNHYAALDLLPGAPAGEVEEAWKALKRRYNPQRAGEAHLADLGDSLTAITDRAGEAFEILSTPSSRERYDRILQEVEQEQQSLNDGPVQRPGDEQAKAKMVEANFQHADQLVREGEFYLAIQLLQQACDLEPRPSELVKLARLMMKNPLWTDRALARLKQAIQADPHYVEAWIELAMVWRRRDDPERQRKALERALNADPHHEGANQMYLELVGESELERLLRRVKLRRS